MLGITGLGDGVDCMVMQSSQDADVIINKFEEYIQQGYHPNDIEQDIYAETGINPDNLIIYDKERISEAVNDLYKMYN